MHKNISQDVMCWHVSWPGPVKILMCYFLLTGIKNQQWQKKKNKLWDVLISEISRCSLDWARFPTISRFMWSQRNSFLAVAFYVKYRQECYWSPQPHQTLSARLITLFQVLLSWHYKVTSQRRGSNTLKGEALHSVFIYAHWLLLSV